MDRKVIYRKALDQWGVEAQIKMAAEECAELIMALLKLGREMNGSTVQQVQEEICDVQIMLEQLREIFQTDYESIEEKKLQRLSEILDLVDVRQ